jgi:hypothetical protein
MFGNLLTLAQFYAILKPFREQHITSISWLTEAKVVG